MQEEIWKPVVDTGNSSKRSYFAVHRLVAQSFIPNPDNKPMVNHINGCKTDNRAENLEWCTQFENMRHAVRIGIIKTGEDNPNAKLTNEQVLYIRCHLMCARKSAAFTSKVLKTLTAAHSVKNSGTALPQFTK